MDLQQDKICTRKEDTKDNMELLASGGLHDGNPTFKGNDFEQ